MKSGKTQHILLAIMVVFLALLIGLSLLIIISKIILVFLIPILIVFFFIVLFSSSFKKSGNLKKIRRKLENFWGEILKLIRELFD